MIVKKVLTAPRLQCVDLLPDLSEPDRQTGHRSTESRPIRWVTTTDVACRPPWTGSWTALQMIPVGRAPSVR